MTVNEKLVLGRIPKDGCDIKTMPLVQREIARQMGYLGFTIVQDGLMRRTEAGDVALKGE